MGRQRNQRQVIAKVFLKHHDDLPLPLLCPLLYPRQLDNNPNLCGSVPPALYDTLCGEPGSFSTQCVGRDLSACTSGFPAATEADGGCRLLLLVLVLPLRLLSPLVPLVVAGPLRHDSLLHSCAVPQLRCCWLRRRPFPTGRPSPAATTSPDGELTRPSAAGRGWGAHPPVPSSPCEPLQGWLACSSAAACRLHQINSYRFAGCRDLSCTDGVDGAEPSGLCAARAVGTLVPELANLT